MESSPAISEDTLITQLMNKSATEEPDIMKRFKSHLIRSFSLIESCLIYSGSKSTRQMQAVNSMTGANRIAQLSFTIMRNSKKKQSNQKLA
ncbi:hypothetical protein D3C81_1582430 [compost metagenome]